MSTALVMLCLLGESGERPYHEIRDDLRGVLRREATAATDRERAQAIHAMTELYEELKRDPRQYTSETIKGYRSRLWSRLTQVKKELQARFAREARERGDQVAPSARQSDWSAASASLAGHLDLVGHAMGGPVGLLSQARNGESNSGSANAGGARGGAAVADFGPELVELIQRTIAPDFWDVNGGPGSIVYYRPLHALVVRASGEVHGDVGGLIGALR